jgi:hypothetical protein
LDKKQNTRRPPAYTIITNNKISFSELNYLKNKNIYPITLNNQEPPKEKIKSIIEAILENNKSKSVFEKLEFFVNNLSEWKSLHPHHVVALLNDKLNIQELNKFYFDSAYGAFCYTASEKEKEYSRNEFRKIKNEIKKILKFIPNTKCHIQFSNSQRIYRIQSNADYTFVNKYTAFNFIAINSDIHSDILNDNLDLSYDKAFNYYYLQDNAKAREVFLFLINRYYNQSLFIKALLCAFNKKMSCNTLISFANKNYHSIIEASQEEHSASSDVISETLDKFPKSILKNQKYIMQGLDVNNSFFLLQFKDIMNLSVKINDDINKMKNGTIFIDPLLIIDKMRNTISNIIIFLLNNRITLQFSSDYKQICKIAFQSIIKWQAANANKETKSISIGNIDLYLALNSFDKNDKITDFLKESLQTDQSLEMNQETFEYVKTIMKNCQDVFFSNNSKHLKETSKKIYHNIISVLSFIKHKKETLEIITDSLIKNFDSDIYIDLLEAINLFIIFQFNKFSETLDHEVLKRIIYKILQKDQRNDYLIRQHSQLLRNTSYMIQSNNTNAEYKFNKDKEISKFLNQIKSDEFQKQFSIADNFLLSIFLITTGDLQNEIKALLVNIFNESKKQISDDNTYIIFALNLYTLKIISDNDFTSIIDKLHENIENDLDSNRTSNAYITIKDQLLEIKKHPYEIEKFNLILEKVSKLVHKMHPLF